MDRKTVAQMLTKIFNKRTLLDLIIYPSVFRQRGMRLNLLKP